MLLDTGSLSHSHVPDFISNHLPSNQIVSHLQPHSNLSKCNGLALLILLSESLAVTLSSTLIARLPRHVLTAEHIATAAAPSEQETADVLSDLSACRTRAEILKEL